MDIEITETSKKYKIDYYDFTKEIGGVLLGYRLGGTNWQLDPEYGVIQLPNPSTDGTIYVSPNALKLPFQLLRRIPLGTLIKKVGSGMELLGEWHSDLGNIRGLSVKDQEAINKRIEQRGFWLVGVVTRKNKAKLRMDLNMFREKFERRKYKK